MFSLTRPPLSRDQTQILWFWRAGHSLLWEAAVTCVLEGCPCMALCAPPPGSKSVQSTRCFTSLVQHGCCESDHRCDFRMGTLPLHPEWIERKGPKQRPWEGVLSLCSQELTIALFPQLPSTPPGTPVGMALESPQRTSRSKQSSSEV